MASTNIVALPTEIQVGQRANPDPARTRALRMLTGSMDPVLHNLTSAANSGGTSFLQILCNKLHDGIDPQFKDETDELYGLLYDLREEWRNTEHVNPTCNEVLSICNKNNKIRIYELINTLHMSDVYKPMMYVVKDRVGLGISDDKSMMRALKELEQHLTEDAKEDKDILQEIKRYARGSDTEMSNATLKKFIKLKDNFEEDMHILIDEIEEYVYQTSKGEDEINIDNVLAGDIGEIEDDQLYEMVRQGMDIINLVGDNNDSEDETETTENDDELEVIEADSSILNLLMQSGIIKQ